jgi:hypothetical protein
MNHLTVTVDTEDTDDEEAEPEYSLFQTLLMEYTNPEEVLEELERAEDGDDGELLRIPVYARKGEEVEAVKDEVRELIDD